MRTIAALLITLFSFFGASTVTNAQQQNACKQCREQQKACTANYSAKTCKTEYDICIKACKKN